MKFLMFIAFIFTANSFANNCNKKDIEILSQKVDFVSCLNLGTSGLAASEANDIWGWTDPVTHKEYAIMGLNSKTSFIDISDPENPVHLVDVKTHSNNSIWRDIKIYKNYAYIVSEAFNHGLQIFDLEHLREVSIHSAPVIMEEDAHFRFNGSGSTHNIFINEDTGYGYLVGTKSCDGGMYIVNLKDPLDPKFVNCVGRGVYELPNSFHGDAYTHDVQCVVYSGPDTNFLGREICVSSNEDTVNIVDVTDKENPFQISVISYPGVSYTHQGWLTEDQKYFALGDELDEQNIGNKTKTFFFDLTELTNPKLHEIYTADTKAIDHNMYVKGNYIYQSNYNAGLRILDINNIDDKQINEVAFFDFMPNKDGAVFEGAWSVFPYYKSGLVVLSDIDNARIYILKPNL